MGLEISQDRAGRLGQRFLFCFAAVFLFFGLVVVRLFYLQIIKGHFYWVFSAEHTMKEIRIPASRGEIFDRNHVAIAENRPSFDLALIPQHVTDMERVKETIQKVAGIDPETIEAKWSKSRRSPSYVPVVVASDIPYDKAVRIRAAKALDFDPSEGLDLRGIEVIARPLRSYPLGPIAATTLGYIGEISEKDLAKSQKEDPGEYVLGDLVGATGLERYWEKTLKGEDGYEQKIVDAAGREIMNDELASFMTEEEAQHGDNIVLTIDSRLQKFAEERFQGKAGGLVAIDPSTGEILAIVSSPSYDPSALVSNVSHSYWSGLLSDPRNVLLNRATQGTYPPGSTFKVVTAIAALEEGVIKPDENIRCPGGLQYGGRFFKCWNKGGHGAISVKRAISESCDTFFYQVGLRLGVDRIAKYANLFGLGVKTGIDLEGERSGTIPTAEWKKRVFKQDWQPGENISIAVGQGYDTVTPLQNALMVAQVATGRKIRPHLTKATERDDGSVIQETTVTDEGPLPVSPKTLKIVREGMLGTVMSPGGTAHASQSPYFKMAGKTGTAQVMSMELRERVGGKNAEDHAWFIAFAPADGTEPPKIAVASIVEHGGFGASASAPIVKDVVEKYFELNGWLQKKEPTKEKKNVR